MAKLRIFVSSTCYDLSVVRSELRPFISSLGYEPIMSDYSDILYDPREHTHENCIKEVPNCDMVLLIIGSRFGGTAIPSVMEGINFDELKRMTTKADILDFKDKLSITQLEILKAVEKSIPVFAFVDDKVLHDHHVYEKNKNKPEVMNAIEFPSIQKTETAKYIFEFINFLTHRVKNNSITSFSRLDDIKTTVVGQWSQLFQRLLYENRKKEIESKRYADFSERLDELKAVVLASIATPNLRDIARGAIQYRHLIGFVSSFKINDIKTIILSDFSWQDLLNAASIVEIIEDESDHRFNRITYLILTDRTFYRCRYPILVIDALKEEWAGFISLASETREAIADALLEDGEARKNSSISYYPKKFEDYLEGKRLQRSLDMGDANS